MYLIALDLLAAGVSAAVLVYYVARDADLLCSRSRAFPVRRLPASGYGLSRE